jgi:asparagine synthase (glutamine-hydrolysing)
MDLESGGQPIGNEDGAVIAVVNGEFYGFEEIRADLQQRGHRLKTRTDSEILVHLYEQHGVACLDRLQGEFAFILWDDREKILFAARDRFGVKPLYYCLANKEVIFSSEVKGLQRAGVMLAWDHQGFWEKFVFQAGLGGRTLFDGVSELPPGHYFLGKNGTAFVRQYWDINFPLEQDLPPSQSDDGYAAALQGLLASAVETRMRADVPVACFLSGGIDSNGILGLMTRHAASSLQAFCLSFDDPAFDEFDLAAQSAAHFGVALTKVPVSDQSLAADFSQAVWHCENLIENANVTAKFALSRAVHAAGFRVVLSGDGSDEVFAGYPVFVVDSLRHASPPRRDEFRQRLGMSGEAVEQLLFPEGRAIPEPLRDRLGYFPAWFEIRCRMFKEFAAVSPNGFDENGIYTRLLDSLDLRGQLNGRAILNQSLYIHAKTSLPGITLSLLGDRVEMAHSVESRLPFLDHRVVEFARSLPCSQKIRNGTEKFVLRKAMRLLIPPAICGRRKRPLIAPGVLSDPQSAQGQLVQDLLRSQALDHVPFVDKKAARRLLDRMLSVDLLAKPGLDGPLMAMASACVLAEKFSL